MPWRPKKRLQDTELDSVPVDALQHAIRAAALATTGSTTWDDLAEAGRFAGFHDAEVRSDILHTIGNGWLRCNLEEPLSPDARLTWWQPRS